MCVSFRATAEVERSITNQPDRECSTCGCLLPASFFRLNHQCRTCTNEQKQGRRATLNFAPAASRDCSTCHQTLPGECFTRDASNPSGLSSQCKACQVAARQDRLAAVRATALKASALPTTKVCGLCAQKKPLSEFYRRSAAADGRLTECEACSLVRQRARYAAMRERDSVKSTPRAASL